MGGTLIVVHAKKRMKNQNLLQIVYNAASTPIGLTCWGCGGSEFSSKFLFFEIRREPALEPYVIAWDTKSCLRKLQERGVFK